MRFYLQAKKSEAALFKRKIVLCFFMSCAGITAVYFLMIENIFSQEKDVKAVELAQDEFSQAFNLDHQSKKLTENLLETISSAVVASRAETANKIFHQERANVFFDKEYFFANLTLNSDDIARFQARLADLSELKDIEAAKGEVSPIVDERMSLIDFLANYALRNENDPASSIIADTFVSLLQREIRKDLPVDIKRVALAEKMDFIRILAVMNRDLAVQTMNSLDDVHRKHLRTSYLIGLKSLDLDAEEYALFVNKVAK